jgi:hypothetical protein
MKTFRRVKGAYFWYLNCSLDGTEDGTVGVKC